MTPAVFRAVRPFLTVHSHKDGIDPGVAAPALLALLSGRPLRSLDPRDHAARDRLRSELAPALPPPFLGTSTRRSFLVHAEARTANGGFASREAVIALTAGSAPDVVREWRRGETRFAALLDSCGAGSG